MKYNELEQRIVRAKKMDTMIQELQKERNLLGSGQAKKACVSPARSLHHN